MVIFLSILVKNLSYKEKTIDKVQMKAYFVVFLVIVRCEDRSFLHLKVARKRDAIQ